MVKAVPFQVTLEVFWKSAPFTVRVKLLPPIRAVAGLRLVSTGMLLLIVKVLAEELPPPGPELWTVTLAVPPLVM